MKRKRECSQQRTSARSMRNVRHLGSFQFANNSRFSGQRPENRRIRDWCKGRGNRMTGRRTSKKEREEENVEGAVGKTRRGRVQLPKAEASSSTSYDKVSDAKKSDREIVFPLLAGRFRLHPLCRSTARLFQPGNGGRQQSERSCRGERRLLR